MTLISLDAHQDMLQFLESALGRTRPLQVFQLAGDASARRYFRVVSGEESYVLMVWEPFKNDGSYPFLSVRDHFGKHGVAVPNVIDMAPDKGLVLLEDLGDLTLERKFWENQDQRMSMPYYKQAIDELIKMHYPSSFDRNDCTAFKMEFDVEKLLWEMNYGREHVLKGICGITLTDAENKELDRIFLDVCSTLHKEPKFIAHRDYHSRNVMLKLGRARIIDFQDARMGSVQYDLVSLLRDSYVRMGEDMALDLIDYYLECREHVQAPTPLAKVDRDQFLTIYEVQTVQRCFKACGSFASFYNLRKDTRYLKYLAPTLQTVKKSLLLFDGYRAFHDILTDRGVFEQKFEVA